jgi:hypothetical protein
MMTERKLREQKVQIARYRRLERDVTDPLAACLLHIVILELEADLSHSPPIQTALKMEDAATGELSPDRL